jgi:hypothetical protein
MQISINPPENGQVEIQLWSIELFNDREVHRVIEGPETNIANLLDQALAEVRAIMSEDATQPPPG